MSSLRTDLTVDRAELDRDIDRWISDVLLEGSRSIASTTRQLEQALEGVTRTAVKGRLHRAWKSEHFPTSDIPAYNPAGRVFVNGKGPRSIGAMQYWTQPGLNRAKGGKYLAVPLPAAQRNGRTDRDITPARWQVRSGMKLRFVDRGNGKFPVLVADAARNRFGQLRSYDPAKVRGGQRLDRVTVPLFVLIPFQRFANKVAIDPVVKSFEIMLARDYEQRVAGLERLS